MVIHRRTRICINSDKDDFGLKYVKINRLINFNKTHNYY